MELTDNLLTKINSDFGTSFSREQSHVFVFDKLCEIAGTELAKLASNKRKRWALYHYATNQKKHRKPAKEFFIDVCIHILKIKNGQSRNKIESAKRQAENRQHKARKMANKAARILNVNLEELLSCPTTPTAATYENLMVLGGLPASKFYQIPEWKRLRYAALSYYDQQCMLCGAKPKSGVVLHVDHILPRHLYPEKALDFQNLQVLCENCNHGKYHHQDASDWRR